MSKTKDEEATGRTSASNITRAKEIAERLTNADRKVEATGTIPDELYTKKEIAKRLRISPRKIELDPEWPKIKFGRTVRYSWPDVVAYLKAD